MAEIVARARAADTGGLERELIVVDDGSTDGTAAALAVSADVRVLSHHANRGKGAAVKTGLAAAHGDIFLIQDGDLEYCPDDYRIVLEPLLAGKADAVLGTRFAGERPRFFFGQRRSPFFTHYIGNLAIVRLTNLLYDAAISDYEGGYKAFRREAVAGLSITADGFEFDNELVCKLMRRGARITEVSIRYCPRGYEEGKKIRWTDGVRILWTIVRWRFAPLD